MNGTTQRSARANSFRHSGILLVDKPGGMTSHDVVARTRKLVGTRKVGHAGTLDPMATGLLVLGLNSSTRLLTYIVGLDKEYLATIRLGYATTTDDAEGDPVGFAVAGAIAALTPEQIAAGIAELTGEISQVPSTVSAIKVDGKRAYARVRAGETVELKARAVTIRHFELLETTIVETTSGDVLELTVRIECSTGTYIRALARDLGIRLGVGGHLTVLRRTRIGDFAVQDAHPVENPDVAGSLLAPAEVAERLFPTITLTQRETVDLGHGKRLDRTGLAAGPVAAISPAGQLVGLIEMSGGQAKAVINFPADGTE